LSKFKGGLAKLKKAKTTIGAARGFARMDSIRRMDSLRKSTNTKDSPINLAKQAAAAAAAAATATAGASEGKEQGGAGAGGDTGAIQRSQTVKAVRSERSGISDGKRAMYNDKEAMSAAVARFMIGGLSMWRCLLNPILGTNFPESKEMKRLDDLQRAKKTHGLLVRLLEMSVEGEMPKLPETNGRLLVVLDNAQNLDNASLTLLYDVMDNPKLTSVLIWVLTRSVKPHKHGGATGSNDTSGMAGSVVATKRRLSNINVASEAVQGLMGPEGRRGSASKMLEAGSLEDLHPTTGQAVDLSFYHCKSISDVVIKRAAEAVPVRPTMEQRKLSSAVKAAQGMARRSRGEIIAGGDVGAMSQDDVKNLVGSHKSKHKHHHHIHGADIDILDEVQATALAVTQSKMLGGTLEWLPLQVRERTLKCSAYFSVIQCSDPHVH
jgi:hypothetical protein